MIEEILRREKPELWPLIVFSGTSGSGKTEFKKLLSDEINRYFDGLGIESNVFRWTTSRQKRSEENLDHIFIDGESKEKRELELYSLNLDYINRHPDNMNGNLYGWNIDDIIASLRKGPVTFSISAEHTEKVIGRLQKFVPHIATIGLISDRAKQNVISRGIMDRVAYFDDEHEWFMRYFDMYNYVIENHGFDERLMQFDPDEFYKHIRRKIMRAKEISIYTILRAIRGEESRPLGSREFSKRLNDEYIKNKLKIIRDGKIVPSKPLRSKFLYQHPDIGVQTFDRTLEANVSISDSGIAIVPVAGPPRNKHNVYVPYNVLNLQFGNSGIYGLDDRQPHLKVEVKNPVGSLDEFGEKVKPEINALWEKYVKPVDGKRNETPVSEDDLERIVLLAHDIAMMQIERKVKPVFLFGQDENRRIREGMFPFIVDNDQGNEYKFYDAHFAISGVGINFLYQCFLLTRDKAYLDEANEGLKHIKSKDKISNFSLAFILGELVDFASHSEGKIAREFIEEKIRLITESYDETLGIFQNNKGSNTINAYSHTLPKLIKFAISKGFIEDEWNSKLQRHIENYKKILIRGDGSVAEQAELVDGEWIHKSTLGYDKENNGNSHFLRLQTMALDMMLESSDIEIVKKIADYIENNITGDFKIPVDEKYPKHRHWQDNAATVNAIMQYNRLYQITGYLRYRTIANKLLIGILHQAIDFEEHKDGLIKGVFYDVKNGKGINCSFIFSDYILLKILKK